MAVFDTQAMKDGADPLVERSDSSTTIHKPCGTFTLLYGHHYATPTNQHIPPDTTDICIETASTNWVKEPLHALFTSRVFPQFSEAFQRAEEKHIPTYIMDPAIHHAIPVGIAEASLLAAEAVLGMRIGKKVLKTLREKGRGLSRRELLGVSARMLGALWLLLPGVSGVGRLASTLSDAGHEPTATALRFSHAVHPEQFLCTATLRNVVLAHKQEWLMKHFGGYPHITTIVGSMHVDIETCILSSPEERLRFLDRVMPILKPMVIPDTFAAIARCQYEGGGWKERGQWEVPELRKYL